MNNYQLLELASKMKLDLIISTGMAEYKDIKKTYNFLKKRKTIREFNHTPYIF